MTAKTQLPAAPDWINTAPFGRPIDKPKRRKAPALVIVSALPGTISHPNTCAKVIVEALRAAGYDL